MREREVEDVLSPSNGTPPAAERQATRFSRKPYVRPALLALGSVRDLTLGTSGRLRDVGTRTRT